MASVASSVARMGDGRTGNTDRAATPGWLRSVDSSSHQCYSELLGLVNLLQFRSYIFDFTINFFPPNHNNLSRVCAFYFRDKLRLQNIIIVVQMKWI